MTRTKLDTIPEERQFTTEPKENQLPPQCSSEDGLIDPGIMPRHLAVLCSTAAFTNETNKGCGCSTRLFSSGWNWTPTNQG